MGPSFWIGYLIAGFIVAVYSHKLECTAFSARSSPDSFPADPSHVIVVFLTWPLWACLMGVWLLPRLARGAQREDDA